MRIWRLAIMGCRKLLFGIHNIYAKHRWLLPNHYSFLPRKLKRQHSALQTRAWIRSSNIQMGDATRAEFEL